MRALSAADADCFIHVDKKKDIGLFRPHGKGEANVVWLPDRVEVSWAGLSVVYATLRLLAAAFAASKKYDYYVLLSGQDYPIKTQSFIADFLASQPYRQHLKALDCRQSPLHLAHIAYYVWMDKWFTGDEFLRQALRKLSRPFRKPVPAGRVPYCGSQWWGLTEDCVEYILKYVQTHPELLRYYRTTWAPDEHVFHTIVFNSPFRSQTAGVIGPELWDPAKFSNLHIIHPSLTKIYGADDFEEIKNSEKCFVRKTTSEKSSSLLDMIDDALLQRHCPGAPGE